MNTQVQAVSFSILDNAVRIIDGLYSLNDLHKASGNENKHRPSLFMANAQTKDLINELNSEAGITASLNKRSVKTIKGGDTNLQGTYVCRELVYSYAMWISAKFHLMVIRAFDAMYAPSVEQAELPVPPKNLHLALTKAIKTIGKGNRQNYSALYTRVYEKFQVNSYKELTVEQCQAAIEFIKSVEGEFIGRDKIAAPKPSLALCDGQHYVVAKDGEVLLHKVLSSDINDSFLKQNSVDALLIDIPREATRHNNTMMPNLHTLSTLYDGYGFKGNPLVGLFATLTQAQKEGKPVMIKDVAGARLIYDMTEALARQYSNALESIKRAADNYHSSGMFLPIK